MFFYHLIIQKELNVLRRPFNRIHIKILYIRHTAGILWSELAATATGIKEVGNIATTITAIPFPDINFASPWIRPIYGIIIAFNRLLCDPVF